MEIPGCNITNGGRLSFITQLCNVSNASEDKATKNKDNYKTKIYIIMIKV